MLFRSLLYLSRKEGGLELPSLTGLYKRLQVSHQCQLLTSSDPCVCRIAEDGLQCEVRSQRAKFCPAVVVRDAMKEGPSRSRKALVAAAKLNMTEKENCEGIKESVTSLDKDTWPNLLPQTRQRFGQLLYNYYQKEC